MDYNILIADFAGKNRICMTDTLYQYDYGQKLKIESIPALPQTFEAHFSNVQHGGVSITVTGMDGIVDIPNSLLMTGKRIYCWIYVTEPGSGETEYQVLIPVQARPMPEYYDVTDVGVFDSVVQQVGDYAATATAGATNATASATAAATSASEAAASASAAETAKNAAETAQGNAEDAQTAAETAAQTATEKAQQTAQDAAQAALDAGRAESAAGRAETAETGAESAKTDAETAAQGAADSASAASASATSAGQAATSAAQSATAAAGSATTAQGAAQTATTKAGEASASADAAAASETAAQTAQQGAEAAKDTAVANATTATTKAAEAAQSASNAADSETAAEAAATRAETAAASLTVDSALSDTSTNPVQNKVITGEIADVKSAIDALKIVDTASGAIASFPDGAAMPVESLTVSMEPIQEGTGDPSPDNIRPISGRESVTAWRTGVNVWDEEWELGGINVTTGENVANASRLRSKNYIPVVGGESYYFAFDNVYTSGTWFTVHRYGKNKEYLGNINPNKNTAATMPNGTYFIRFNTSDAWSGATYTGGISINYPATDHDYHAYDGQSVTVQLGQAVYGGTVDVTTGAMTVDRAMVDLGSFVWLSEATDASGQFRVSQTQIAPLNPKYSSVQCSMLKGVGPKGYSQFNYGEIGLSNTPTVPILRVRAENFIGKTGEEIKAIMQGQQLVYELAAPLEITLDPATLSTLKGQNNVWSDADTVSVDYVADPKLYIARLTEPDADMVADANITSGSYFMVGNNLYIATSNIASGATIVPGVNCTRTNLAAALNAINA